MDNSRPRSLADDRYDRFTRRDDVERSLRSLLDYAAAWEVARDDFGSRSAPEILDLSADLIDYASMLADVARVVVHRLGQVPHLGIEVPPVVGPVIEWTDQIDAEGLDLSDERLLTANDGASPERLARAALESLAIWARRATVALVRINDEVLDESGRAEDPTVEGGLIAAEELIATAEEALRHMQRHGLRGIGVPHLSDSRLTPNGRGQTTSLAGLAEAHARAAGVARAAGAASAAAAETLGASVAGTGRRGEEAAEWAAEAAAEAAEAWGLAAEMWAEALHSVR